MVTITYLDPPTFIRVGNIYKLHSVFKVIFIIMIDFSIINRISLSLLLPASAFQILMIAVTQCLLSKVAKFFYLVYYMNICFAYVSARIC